MREKERKKNAAEKRNHSPTLGTWAPKLESKNCFLDFSVLPFPFRKRKRHSNFLEYICKFLFLLFFSNMYLFLSLLDNYKTVKASQERQRGVWNRGHNYGALNQPLLFITFLLFLVPWSDPEIDFPNLFHAIKIKTVCGFLSICFLMLLLFQTNIISVFNLWFMAGVSIGFRIFILFCFYIC